jgi:hypothetical protein
LFLLQVPPLTPSTNKKVGEVLKTTYATWEKDAERLCIPKDPRMWTPDHVGHWLSWAIREFSLAGPNFTQFVQQFQVITTKCSLNLLALKAADFFRFVSDKYNLQ